MSTPTWKGLGFLFLLGIGCTASSQTSGGINVADSTFLSATASTVVNVKDFTGATDDLAVQKAVNALSGGTVYMLAGNYTFAHSVALKSGVALVGAGIEKTVISGTTLMAGNHFFVANSATDVALSDMTLNGPSGATPPGTVDVRGVNASACTRCRFERLRITSVSDGVDILGNSNDCLVANNAMLNGNNQGIAVQGNRNRIEHNQIEHWGVTNLHHGIYGQQGEDNQYLYNQIYKVQGFCIHIFNVTARTVISNVQIVGNHCTDSGLSSGTRGGYAFAAGARSSTAHGATILENTADGFHGSGLYISDASEVSARANVFRNFQGDGIVVQTAPGFAVSERISLIANQISNGTVLGNGINIVSDGSAVRNLTVSLNQIDTVFGVGIWMRGVSDSVFYGNRIKDYNSQANSSNDGVRIESTSVRNVVEANRIFTNSGSAHAIHVVGRTDVDNSLIGNSFLQGSWTIKDDGTRTLKTNNNVYAPVASFQADVGSTTFAHLGSPPVGYVTYCSDCKPTTPCTSGGAGAIAKRLSSVWICD